MKRTKYSESTVSNLKSWQKGISGNPSGRPKGSRNIKSIIIDLLNDENTYDKLPIPIPESTRTPLEAIIYTLISKSIAGDIRASDVLLKYAVDRESPIEESIGFFDHSQINILVVDGKGDQYIPHNLEIDETTGLFKD